MADDPWLTVDEIAKELNASEWGVRRWLRNKELEGTNFGGRMGWRVRRSALDRYIARRTGSTEGKADALTGPGRHGYTSARLATEVAPAYCADMTKR
jgi:excisionase family DNA binding protein